MPDLMILDLRLPAGDGFSILERMKANETLASIPVHRETQCSRAVAMVKAKMLYTTSINRCLLSQRAPSLQEEKRSRTQRYNLGPGWSESAFERNHDLPCCAKS